MTTFHDLAPCTFYLAIGLHADGDMFALGDMDTNLPNAATTAMDAILNGLAVDAWVIEVQSGVDVTEAAKAEIRKWCLHRYEDWHPWADAAQEQVA